MKSTHLIMLLAWVILSHHLPIAAQNTTPQNPAPAKPRTFAVIVCGLNNDPELKITQNKIESQLLESFPKSPDSPPQTVFLADDSSPIRLAAVKTDRDNLKQTLTDLAKKITPTDRFIFYYLGQANLVVDRLRFNIPGPDLTDSDLADWLKPVTAADQLIILDCPAAGHAFKALAAPGRILIAAARADQPYATRFSEFFLTAWQNPESDLNHDSRVSLLEAFQRTAQQIDEYFRKANLMATEIPLLDDNTDGVPSQQPWLFLNDQQDGAKAATWFLKD